MNDLETVKRELNKRSTEELTSIYAANNREEWTDEAFEAIRIILKERDSELPPVETSPPVKRVKEPSPNRIPHGLGLVFAALTWNIDGLSRLNSGLLTGAGYLIGMFTGYGILRLSLRHKWKTTLAWLIGIIVAGGFLTFKSMQEARLFEQTRQTSGGADIIDEYLLVFPLSSDGKAAFMARIQNQRLSEDQVHALVWQLMAEGETLMSEAHTREMSSYYWKAVETLTPEEQMFITKINLKLSQGQGYSASDQQASSVLIQKGFGNLSERDNARYLELKGKAIELALLQPDVASRQFKATYPPAESNVAAMTLEQKQQRMQEFIGKAVSLLPENDRVRFMELQMTPADQLTKSEHAERVKYSEMIKSQMSEDELKAMMEIAASIALDMEN